MFNLLIGCQCFPNRDIHFASPRGEELDAPGLSGHHTELELAMGILYHRCDRGLPRNSLVLIRSGDILGPNADTKGTHTAEAWTVSTGVVEVVCSRSFFSR